MHKGKLTNINPPRITTEPTPPFEYYDTYKFDWFIENGRLYIDYDTGESIIIDYPHVNGNYFYGTIGNFDFRLEYDGGRSVKRQADISK